MNFKKFVVAAVSVTMVAPFASVPSAMAAGPSNPEVTKSSISEGQAHFWLATTNQKVRLKLGLKDAQADVIEQDAGQLELYPLYPKIKKGGVLRYTFIIESLSGKQLAPKKTIEWRRWAKYKSSCDRRKPTLMIKSKSRPEGGYVRAVKVKGKNKGKKIVRRLKVELDEGSGSYMLTRKSLSKQYRINGMAVLMTEGPNAFKSMKCF